MKLSYDKMIHLSHVLVDVVAEDDRTEFLTERNGVRQSILRVLEDEMRRESEIEEGVRRKIRSLKRNVPEGSSEWDVLYSKYYEEELERLRPTR